MSKHQFPSLDNFEPTRQTLHRYALAVGVIPRAHAKAHPKWWHISLRVQENGLRTEDMALPGGGSFHLLIDLQKHAVELHKGDEVLNSFAMTAGKTATEMGAALIAALTELGLEDAYDRARYDNEDPRVYDKDLAGDFLTAINLAQTAFARHRQTLEGDPGIIQLWPHGFDLAFEWFGSKQVPQKEDGQTTLYPSQINLGFSLGEANHKTPYFYSNPWPFDESLMERPLPHGAGWFNQGWQGSLLEYEAVAGDPDGPQKLFEYAQAVFKLAQPSLMA